MGFVYLLEKNDQNAISVLEYALDIPGDSILQAETEFHTETLGQRLCWCACGELALFRNDPLAALRIADQLLACSANISGGGIIPRVSLLRGRALIGLHRYAEAEEIILAVQKTVEAEQEKPLLLRTYIVNGYVLQLENRPQEADRAFTAARNLIEELSVSIVDTELREQFSKYALALLPKPPIFTSRQIAKKEYGGLTSRERDLAVLIARGDSNRVIAEKLVLSERTVENHVGNILTKLGLSSRAQIAVWAVEKGLGKEKN